MHVHCVTTVSWKQSAPSFSDFRIAERDSCWFRSRLTEHGLLACCSIWKSMRNLSCDPCNHLCNNIFRSSHPSVHQAHSLHPSPPPIRARPTSMDEERSAPAISPEPPDDGDPSLAAPQPSSHATSSTETASSCPNPKPSPSAGKEGVALEKQTNLHKLISQLWCAGRASVCRKNKWLHKQLCDGSGLALNRLMFMTITTASSIKPPLLCFWCVCVCVYVWLPTKKWDRK